jgi:cell fate regulator YaaT (PSP1 superfamily)
MVPPHPAELDATPSQLLEVASAAPPTPLTVTSVKASTVRFVIVQFKHDTATFVAPFKVSVGDLVVVEGDRGENIGVVSEITKETPEYAVPNKVVRRATDKDREALAAQREREVAAVVSTRALAESFGLHGRVEDAEYQFDLNKLTIFVRRPSKSTFVDFRKLQRSLFREFRCRIWCAYLDEVEAAEAAPRCK